MTLPRTIPNISPAESFLPGLMSSTGTLAPTVMFTHIRKVVFSPEGRAVSGILVGAELFEGGWFEGSEAVLLYISRESAKEDAR